MSLPTDAAERKNLPVFTFLTEYFPDAILELVRICVAGNIQHNPERAPNDIVWTRGKSTDQMDCAFRHMFDHKRTGPVDTDGRYHLGKAAWRNLAELQLTLEKEKANDAITPTDPSPRVSSGDRALEPDAGAGEAGATAACGAADQPERVTIDWCPSPVVWPRGGIK